MTSEVPVCQSFVAVQRILLAVERLIRISHYLKRRHAVRVKHQRVDLSGSRSIVEALDWHGEDRLHNLASPSLIASLGWPPSFHEDVR